MNNLTFFGFDFIFDKKGQIYFLEANSFPGLIKDLDLFYKKSVLDEMVNISKKMKLPIVVIYTDNAYKTWREPKYICNELKKRMDNFKLIIFKKEELKTFSLKTLRQKGIIEGIIFTPYLNIRKKISSKNKNFKAKNGNYRKNTESCCKALSPGP